MAAEKDLEKDWPHKEYLEYVLEIKDSWGNLEG